MYWTTDRGIMKAWMDGTNSVEIVSGLRHPMGVTMDYESPRLFWVEQGSKKVQSSGSDGSNVVTLAQLKDTPLGIAVDATRVYFSSYAIPSVLRSCNKTGGDMKELYTYDGGDEMGHIALITSRPPLATRQNHCANQNCSGICVLIPNSYRCLSF